MWVFAKGGFVSAVEHRDDSSLVIVRARRREHLQGWGMIDETPEADYRFRVTMSKALWVQAVAGMAADVNYHNFKGSIGDDEYHDTLLDVWGVMKAYQDKGVEDAEAHATDADSPRVGVLSTDKS